MTYPTAISIQPPKRLDAPQDLDLARRAYATANTPWTRSHLAYLLSGNDAFAEVIEVLTDTPDPGFGEKMLLCRALLAVTTDEASARARAVALDAFALAENDIARAAALAEAAKAERRQGMTGVHDTLTRALAFDPHNPDTFKRLATYHLEAGDPATLIDLIDRLAAQGVGHSRLLAYRTLVLARCDDLPAARANDGLDAFLYRIEVTPPPGWQNVQAFNAALATQLAAHPQLRYEGYGTAARQSWRIDTPLSPSAPLVAVLLERIRDEVACYIDRVARHDHPWLRARPATARLRHSCVIAEADGFETWHMHQLGWLSGVYYVQVPDGIARGEDAAGCIAWGLPEDLAGSALARVFGQRLERPAPGALILFPSHVHHRTFPHGFEGKRVCLAFDIEAC